MVVEISIEGRECLKMSWVSGEAGPSASAVGGLAFLKAVRAWVESARGEPAQWSVPEGRTTAEILLREAILRFRGQWTLPYAEEELCHCRAVPRETVENAIRCGAHTTEMVSRWTSASTACGTCRPDSQALIDYLLFSPGGRGTSGKVPVCK